MNQQRRRGTRRLLVEALEGRNLLAPLIGGTGEVDPVWSHVANTCGDVLADFDAVEVAPEPSSSTLNDRTGAMPDDTMGGFPIWVRCEDPEPEADGGDSADTETILDFLGPEAGELGISHPQVQPDELPIIMDVLGSTKDFEL